MKKLILLVLLLPYLSFGQNEDLIAPEFPGGNEAMWQYIYNNLEYPKECKNKNYSGVIVCTVHISEVGKIDSTTILNHGEYHIAFEIECIRLISTFPEFHPAAFKNLPVKSSLKIPINFQAASTKTTEYYDQYGNFNHPRPEDKESLRDNTINDNFLEFITSEKYITTKPRLKQDTPLYNYLQVKLKGLNTKISIGFNISKKGETKGVYLIDSYRELNKEEIENIKFTFSQIKWIPGQNNDRVISIRCSYDIKLD